MMFKFIYHTECYIDGDSADLYVF